MNINLELATDGDTIHLVLGAWSLVHDARCGKIPNIQVIIEDLEALLIDWGSSVHVNDPACAQLIKRIKQLQDQIRGR